MSEDLVLVTGGSGFVAAHCIVQLLGAGYRVRTTVRSLTREAEVRGMVAVGGVEARERLTFATADLERDAGWRETAAGCRYVALWDPEARLVAPELGLVKRVSGEKARRVLGWVPQSREEAIVSAGESLVRLGLVG